MTGPADTRVVYLDGPDHLGLFSEPDPVMYRRHLEAEVLRDLDPPMAETPWVLVVAGDPVEWFATRDEAVSAGWDFVDDDNDRRAEAIAADYDGALDAALRNGVR